MAVGELIGAAPLPSAIEASEVESRRFGLAIGRLTLPSASGASVDDVLALVAASELDVIVLRHPAAWVRFSAAFATSRRVAIHADTLVYWSVPARSPALRTPPADTSVRHVSDRADFELLDEMVADLFAGYGNHYLANPLLDPAGKLAGYQEWAPEAVADPGCEVILVSDAEAPFGLATIAVGESTEILLAGVRDPPRSRSLQPRARCRGRCCGGGSTDVVISTQVHNIDVQRAWARHGFLPMLAVDTLHLVRPELLASLAGAPAT